MSIPSRKEIGDSLQKLRIKAGFDSAKKFAEYIGINEGTYTGYEQGKGMFTYERAWLIADALHCSLDELGGREWPPDGAATFTDPLQQRMNDAYETLSSERKAAASAAVSGIAEAASSDDNSL